MDIPSSLAIVALAALIHASFQLSVSVLTLLSSHTIGARFSSAKVARLTGSFVFGASVMSVLGVAFIAFVVLALGKGSVSELAWAIGCGLLIGVGGAVWLFYYRKDGGTSLWIPRRMARHLSDRSKVTKHSAEAFSLGLTSVLSEGLFIFAPMLISAFVLVGLPGEWQLVGVGLYGLISTCFLALVWALVGSGHKLSTIQKWRENNKRFLQFAAGSALAVLGFFVFVCEIIGGGQGMVW